MKVFNYDSGFESFFDDDMKGKTCFDVVVGSGQPQRVYPENESELSDCRENVAKSAINPPIGAYYSERVR